jgi:hypothetical protein
VDGTITGTSAVNLNAGVITGTGTIDPLTVNINSGTIFAPANGTPGSSMAIVGNLAFQSGAYNGRSPQSTRGLIELPRRSRNPSKHEVIGPSARKK